jgi:mannosyltransferase PIG-V
VQDARGSDGWSIRAVLPSILLAFVASRLVLIAIVVLYDAANLGWERTTYSTAFLLDGLTGHDALYYLGIASSGYHLEPVYQRYPDWVFFPAYPIAVKIASVLTLGNVALAGVLVSNGALLAAMVVIARLMQPRATLEVARTTQWLFVFAPGAIAFGMAYSDTLMILATAGALLAARGRRVWLVALLFGVATLCRPPGILMGVPIAVALWEAMPRRRLAFLALAAGPIALLLFAAYQGVVLGDPLAFIHGQALWQIPKLTDSATPGTATETNPAAIPLAMLLLGTLLAYTAMLPGLLRSKLPRSQQLVAVMAFVSVFLSGRIQSDARYLAAGWPFAWFLAQSRRGVRNLAIVLSVAGYVAYGLLNISQLIAP